MTFTLAPDLDAIVRPGVLWLEGAVVVDRDPRLDGPLAQAEGAVRVNPPEATAVVRTMYKCVGIDPTKPAVKRRKLREDELYELAIRRASALSIPRLTFDHFLNFVGIERGSKMIGQVAMGM